MVRSSRWFLGVTFWWAMLASASALGAGLELSRAGEPPDQKIVVTSPGVYRAVVYQASGGGINEFYNLASDPEAKLSLAWNDRGLFEVGWHGKSSKNPGADKKTCCNNHALGAKPEDGCYDGCGDWPSMAHKELKATGELAVSEQSPARVRIRTKAPFVWWGKFVHKLTAEAVYTFYPTGRIIIQMHVANSGNKPFHWSGEYGPHITVSASDKMPENDRGFVWSSPKQEKLVSGSPSEELVLAASDKAKTRLMLAIPPEEQMLFTRFMHHDGHTVGWDRAGYGSGGLVMEPGYDNTWACMIQMGASGSRVAQEMRTPAEALPVAMQYRKPPKLQAKGADLVMDDPGDLNRDGFNESEGCYVLRGAGPVEIACEEGKTLCQPAFKIAGRKGVLPEKVTVNGAEAAFVAGEAGGSLVIQLLGIVEGGANLAIGK